MFRHTVAALRVSPYSIYLRELSRKKELTGLPLRDASRIAARRYRALPPAQLKALQARASKAKYPALDAFNRFQRQHAFRFTHLSNVQRQRVIGRMWHDLKKKEQQKAEKLKKKMTQRALKAHKKAAAKKKSSKSKKRKTLRRKRKTTSKGMITQELRNALKRMIAPKRKTTRKRKSAPKHKTTLRRKATLKLKNTPKRKTTLRLRTKPKRKTVSVKQ